MRKHEITEKFIRLSRMCVFNSTAKIKVDTQYSESFNNNTGVRRRDSLS